MTAAARHLVEVLGTRSGDDIPVDTAREVATMLVDHLSVASYGSRTETAIIGRRSLAIDGDGPATIVGEVGTRRAEDAAFANAVAAHSLEFDDIDRSSLLHYGATVGAAALAVAQEVHADGAALLGAVSAGCELMARLSVATNPELRDRGFHTTPACGVFGAALAAGRLLDLDDDQLVNALAFAGAQAGGLMEIYGASMQKRFNPAFAARHGITAARLAGAGATGEESVIDGVAGFAQTFAGRLDEDALLDGLGTDEVARIEIKPYACVRPLHSALDAAVSLRVLSAGDDSEAKIGAIDVDRPPDWDGYFLVPEPRSRHEAQVSLEWSVATAIVHGDADPERFEPGREPAVAALARRVHARVDPTLPGPLSARVTVRLEDGSTRESLVESPRGGREHPLAPSELDAKFRRLLASVHETERVAPLLESAWSLTRCSDVAPVIAEFGRPAG